MDPWLKPAKPERKKTKKTKKRARRMLSAPCRRDLGRFGAILFLQPRFFSAYPRLGSPARCFTLGFTLVGAEPWRCFTTQQTESKRKPERSNTAPKAGIASPCSSFKCQARAKAKAGLLIACEFKPRAAVPAGKAQT